jgi:hypothetical protein
MRNDYLNAVRRMVDQINAYAVSGQFIKYQILDDEINDMTLTSLRVYGSREYADVICVCAGLDFVWQELPTTAIILPTKSDLIRLKQKHIGGE